MNKTLAFGFCDVAALSHTSHKEELQALQFEYRSFYMHRVLLSLKEKKTSKKNADGRSTSGHDKKKFRTGSMEKQRGMAFGFRKTATAVKKNRIDYYYYYYYYYYYCYHHHHLLYAGYLYLYS